MARYDIESLIDDIKRIIVDHYNDALTAIDTEKGDFVLKKLETSDGIALFDSNASNLARDPNMTINVTTDDPLDNAVGGHAVDVEIWLRVRETAERDGILERRIFRYMRALYQLFVVDVRKYNIQAIANVSTIGYFGEPTEGRNVPRKTILTGGIVLQCRIS